MNADELATRAGDGDETAAWVLVHLLVAARNLEARTGEWTGEST